ncbi:hypothetical protein ACQVP2_33745 [Methylobacterium aquaticum]|jgi:hypothetical protein|uniref:hypothetical protein n=1 Tax=Methylobacterium aquaticum TaxID=270351 RepID=UPI003D16EBDF
MIQSITHTSEGYPLIQWQEKVVFCDTQQAIALSILALCMPIGIIISIAKLDFIPVGVAFLVTGALNILVMKALGAPDSPQAKSDLQKPVFISKSGFATIFKDEQGDLYFQWQRGKSMKKIRLHEIKSFELGNAEDWFADKSETGNHHVSFVIIADTDSGIQTIASHAGNKAAITHLHRTLTTEFILNRKNFALQSGNTAYMQSISAKRAHPEKPQTL